MPLRIAQGVTILPPPAGASAQLNVAYIEQEQDNWCWAACCEMVFNFNGVNNVRQCDMSSAQFGGDCCASPSSSACNQGNWPENTYGHYAFNCTKNSVALSLAAVQAEIDSNRPVEVYYAWTGGGAHVALVIGYYDNGDLEVFDPWSSYGPGRRPYSYVLSAYGMGSWTLTYSNLRK
jgi:hypothetical protein